MATREAGSGAQSNRRAGSYAGNRRRPPLSAAWRRRPWFRRRPSAPVWPSLKSPAPATTASTSWQSTGAAEHLERALVELLCFGPKEDRPRY